MSMMDCLTIQWPEDEPIPQSPEEAIRLGWKEGQSAHLDVAKGHGTVEFWKNIDDPHHRGRSVALLRFQIPFTATLTYGPPCEMRATKHAKPPTRYRLFDVEVKSDFLRAKRTIRVLAISADDACDVACEISHDEFTHWARKPDHKRRKVYDLKSFRSDFFKKAEERKARS